MLEIGLERFVLVVTPEDLRGYDPLRTEYMTLGEPNATLVYYAHGRYPEYQRAV